MIPARARTHDHLEKCFEHVCSQRHSINLLTLPQHAQRDVAAKISFQAVGQKRAAYYCWT